MKEAFRERVVENFVQCLLDHGIQLVCFDFDETITVNKKRFISKTFLLLTKALARNDIDMAITTFNTGFNIQDFLLHKGLHEEKHLVFPIVRKFCPYGSTRGKCWHILQAMKYFSVTNPAQVLLIDDLPANVDQARAFGFRALEVQRKRGLTIDDLLRCMANEKYYFPYTPHAPRHLPSIRSLAAFPELNDSKISIDIRKVQDRFGHSFIRVLVGGQPTFLIVEPRMNLFLEHLLGSLADQL